MGMGLLRTVRKPFKYIFANYCFIIIAVNVGVYVLTMLMPGLLNQLALNVVYIVRYKRIWQFVTYMFVHDPRTMTHLLFNMLGLFFFGFNIERSIGSREFLLFYLATGILCGIISFAVYYFTPGGYRYSLMGASGAIYALLLAYAVIFPRARIFIWGILPVPAPLLVLIYAGVALFSQLTSRNIGVAHLTHLAGFVVAWLYIRIRMGISPVKVWRNSYR
jgi:membrane associated rhomboid family serine protease